MQALQGWGGGAAPRQWLWGTAELEAPCESTRHSVQEVLEGLGFGCGQGEWGNVTREEGPHTQ